MLNKKGFIALGPDSEGVNQKLEMIQMFCFYVDDMKLNLKS